MKPAQLRRWMQKYGNLGVLVVAMYLMMHHVWTKHRAALLTTLLLLSFGFLLVSRSLAPQHARKPSFAPQVIATPSKENEEGKPTIPSPRMPSSKSRTSIPTIASIFGVRVGWNGRERLEHQFGEGIYSTGGHPNGVETWATHNPVGTLVTEGFCHNGEGEVLEHVEWNLLARVPHDIPQIRRLPAHAGWLGVIYPGMTEQQVALLTETKGLPAPIKKDDTWTWSAKGFVRPNAINGDIYDTWTASLYFQQGRLMSICLDCSGGYMPTP